MKTLSVIVPVFNSDKYIMRCLDSLCKQDYPALEIVIVDDGSTDRSGDICEQYAHKYKNIKVLHQDNQGPLAARSNGVRNSNGRYVTFVDADDWIEERTYSIFSDMMESGIDLIVYGRMNETEKSGSSMFWSVYQEGMYDRSEIAKSIYPNMMWDYEAGRPGLTQALCDKIFKREMIQHSYNLAKEFPFIHCGEDPMILYPLMQWVNSMYVSRECLYHYRLHIRKVPSYISNDDFFEKAFLWYQYLMQNTREIPNIKKQLEYTYINMITRRKEFYGDFVDNDEYFFPFKDVLADSRVVLYGAGRQGMTFYDQIKRSNYCNIVLWVDRNYKSVENWGVVGPEAILDLDNQFDRVVIAVNSREIKEQIIEWLVDIGVDRNIII